MKDQWRPIKEAERMLRDDDYDFYDCQEVLLCVCNENDWITIWVGDWSNKLDRWVPDEYGQPTHWMPLPKPPQEFSAEALNERVEPTFEQYSLRDQKE